MQMLLSFGFMIAIKNDILSARVPRLLCRGVSRTLFLYSLLDENLRVLCKFTRSDEFITT